MQRHLAVDVLFVAMGDDLATAIALSLGQGSGEGWMGREGDVGFQCRDFDIRCIQVHQRKCCVMSFPLTILAFSILWRMPWMVQLWDFCWGMELETCKF